VTHSDVVLEKALAHLHSEDKKAKRRREKRRQEEAARQAAAEASIAHTDTKVRQESHLEAARINKHIDTLEQKLEAIDFQEAAEKQKLKDERDIRKAHKEAAQEEAEAVEEQQTQLEHLENQRVAAESKAVREEAEVKAHAEQKLTSLDRREQQARLAVDDAKGAEEAAERQEAAAAAKAPAWVEGAKHQ